MCKFSFFLNYKNININLKYVHRGLDVSKRPIIRLNERKHEKIAN